jgi:tetratricopeptide (TPR) repeat protein
MALKSSYTDIVHFIVRDSEENLSLNEIVEKLSEVTEENPPKNPRSTARSAIRNSILIQSVGRDQHGWMPHLLKEARVRVTLQERDLSQSKLFWDTDALLTMWPAFDEPETRRERPDIFWTLESGAKISLSLQEEEEEVLFSEMGSVLHSWIEEVGAQPGDDLIVWCADPVNHSFEVSYLGRSERNEKLISGRNRSVKRKMEEFLATQRDHMAKPREIMASLVASRSYQDSIPPQSLSNLLPEEVISRYGARVPEDKFDGGAKESIESKESKVIPFPKQNEESQEEQVDGERRRSSVALDIPFNTGRELPDEKAYMDGLQMLQDRGAITPALAIHVLNLSRICSPAYALLSQTSEYRKEALDLAGQAVVAAERRIAHGLVESLVTGEEFALEEAIGDYLESRSFLARALWHAGSTDDAIEQAMHCFEVDPEDPAVREDLFVMLFDTDRHDMVVRLLESFPGASATEELYHKALGELLEDPESRDAKKALRKAVSHNSWLASRFLGEDPKKAKRSSVEEGTAYEAAYGFLWRREDVIFDMLEEIVLAKR